VSRSVHRDPRSHLTDCCGVCERQAERARELAAQREAVETARKALKKRAPKEGSETAAAAAAAGERADAVGRGLGLDDEECGGGARGGAAGVSGTTGPVTHQYYLMTEEVYRARLQVTVRPSCFAAHLTGWIEWRPELCQGDGS
jgi:hypothetical protein